MKLKFRGAAQTVTGSRTQFSYRGFEGVVDCGLFQGPKELRNLNWDVDSDIKNIKAILLTHAHIDHSGLIPRWVAQKWRGPIYCTKATKDLLGIMLLDSAHLQEEDARFANRTKHSHHDPALPLYTEEDAKKALTLVQAVDFDQWFNLSDHLSFRFLRAGHILGSAFVQINYSNGNGGRHVTFSGDLGGSHSDVIMDPVSAKATETLILESTYGDRRVDVSQREKKLGEIVAKVISRKGTLIIPAFAVGRTQDILVSLFRLKKKKEIPDCPIYLDSPMALEVTEVYLKHLREFQNGFEPGEIEIALTPPFFRPTPSTDESMLLCMNDDPKIVISASGMLQGGRVLHHLKSKLPNGKNGVLFAGFQGHGTKGRLLQQGIPNIRLHHQNISVEAEIFNVEGYSAHADSDALIQWLRKIPTAPQKIFLNHGELESQKAFSYRVFQELGWSCEIPQANSVYDLDE